MYSELNLSQFAIYDLVLQDLQALLWHLRCHVSCDQSFDTRTVTKGLRRFPWSVMSHRSVRPAESFQDQGRVRTRTAA